MKQTWKNGLPSSPDYFPIGVWLQSPENASRYAAAGINLYVALWQGPMAVGLAHTFAPEDVHLYRIIGG
jgi:hypothetical protein